MLVKIIPSTNGAPAGKLAEAEVCFSDGLLAGLKLVGFGIWEGRSDGRNVTFPWRRKERALTQSTASVDTTFCSARLTTWRLWTHFASTSCGRTTTMRKEQARSRSLRDAMRS